MNVTFTLNEADIREVVDAAAPELSDEKAQEAVEEILALAESICLYSLAEHVFEATGVDLADYEEE
jgi:hypothetical protein